MHTSPTVHFNINLFATGHYNSTVQYTHFTISCVYRCVGHIDTVNVCAGRSTMEWFLRRKKGNLCQIVILCDPNYKISKMLLLIWRRTSEIVDCYPKMDFKNFTSIFGACARGEFFFIFLLKIKRNYKNMISFDQVKNNFTPLPSSTIFWKLSTATCPFSKMKIAKKNFITPP